MYSLYGSITQPQLTAIFVTLLTTILLYALYSILLSEVFIKAGEPRWKAWVPVYNSWTFFEMGGIQGAWSLLIIGAFVPVVGQVFTFMLAVCAAIAAYRLGKAFGKESILWVILFIFFGPVWYAIIGFGRSKYDMGKKPTLLF